MYESYPRKYINFNFNCKSTTIFVFFTQNKNYCVIYNTKHVKQTYF